MVTNERKITLITEAQKKSFLINSLLLLAVLRLRKKTKKLKSKLQLYSPLLQCFQAVKIFAACIQISWFWKLNFVGRFLLKTKFIQFSIRKCLGMMLSPSILSVLQTFAAVTSCINAFLYQFHCWWWEFVSVDIFYSKIQFIFRLFFVFFF